MTCNEYAVLLEKFLEDAITPAEEALLRQHEAQCPACAARRRALDSLQDSLQSLDTPPMPEDFHQAWTQRIKEEAPMLEQPDKRKVFPKKAITRALAVAAAAVFVVGGTLLTRDNPALSRTTKAQEESSYDEAGDTGGYQLNSISYDMAASPEAMPRSASGKLAVTGSLEQQNPEAKIIRSASLTIGTQAYETSLSELKALCESSGGWVSHVSESTGKDGLRYAYLSLRIPADQLDAYLEGTGQLGRMIRREESASDVTESYYDTQARLDTQKALMARLQALVTDAADLSDLLALESQLADTQYEIDRLQSSLDNTDRQVAYSSVDVSLQEESASTLVTADVTFGERLQNAISAGVKAFVDFFADVAVFLTAALPFIAIVAVIALATLLVRKLHKKK